MFESGNTAQAVALEMDNTILLTITSIVTRHLKKIIRFPLLQHSQQNQITSLH